MCGLIPPPPYHDDDSCELCGFPAHLHDDGECPPCPHCHRCGDTGVTSIGDTEVFCDCRGLPW